MHIGERCVQVIACSRLLLAASAGDPGGGARRLCVLNHCLPRLFVVFFVFPVCSVSPVSPCVCCAPLNGTSTPLPPQLHHQFGGQFIPETLVHAHDELAKQYVTLTKDPEFQAEFEKLGRDFIGRPTAMYHAERLSNKLGGAQIWIKREDLAHTGAHKINNAIGQVLLAKKLGKNRIIAETGAGQVRTNSKTVYHRRNSTEAAPHTGARTITD
jgi:hypothetical protein